MPQLKRAFRRRVFVVDGLVLVVAVTIADILSRVIGEDGPADRPGWNHHSLLTAVLVIVWMAFLGLMNSRDISLVGVGAEEYRRVVLATVWVFGPAAVLAVLLRVQISRTHVGIALVLGLICLILARRMLRWDLARRRSRGEYVIRVVILGNLESAHVLCESFARSPNAGYRVVGLCVPDSAGEIGQEVVMPTGLVPVLGDGSAIKESLQLARADALAVAAAEQLGHEYMKKLAWRTQSMNIDLIVVPGVTDIAGHRLRVRPVDNLPLFHIDAPPQQDSPSTLAKRSLDLTLGVAGVFVTIPIMALAALAIKLDDGGPVIFRQERIGFGGKRFKILKLRTMTVDAGERKDPAPTNDLKVFNKSAADPRITRVGRFLRATSIDELPQLFNVLGGSMSIVGPRPLVVGEAESVEHFVARRALVKPGMTGLWQISGRSDLTDDERIRLDHSYVDNWSVVQDLWIIWRTVRAVLKREGAC